MMREYEQMGELDLMKLLSAVLSFPPEFGVSQASGPRFKGERPSGVVSMSRV